MTKIKWQQIFSEEMNKIYSICQSHGVLNGPEDWAKYGKAYGNWIKAMDEATEIYNLENQERK
jgi:hypothetical protein